MPPSTQTQKAEILRSLHHGPRILILPNAWDVASARIVEELGYPAIATTSAGIAASLGYVDGQQIPRREMLDMVARIAAAVRVPVTADFEAGYGTTIEDLAEATRELVSSGAVGLNFEDITGLNESDHVELSAQIEKIQAIRDVSQDILGVPLVVNARTDVYLLPIGPEASRFDRTVERLRAYHQAGADCTFAPGVVDAETVGRLVKAVGAPLNILASQGAPSIFELQRMGVARVSTGSGLMRAALGHARRVAKELAETGTYAAMLESPVPFAELMQILSRGNS
jgi:2-methylisocitrate lyase-like PEP mutase family enzyme